MEETRSQKWNKANKERRNEITREYRKRHLEKLRAKDRERDRTRMYGITSVEYLKMAESQSGQCKICGTTELYGRTRLAIDHCHSTGRIRGLLCTKCNAGLGMFSDNIEKLTNAISYLKEST